MRLAHTALYFADDKAIRDLLISSNRFTKKKLLEIARRRGLILSPASDRKEIASQLALLDYDLPQLNELLSHVESPERAEKWVNPRLVVSADASKVHDALERIKAGRSSADEVYTISKNRDGTQVTAKVTYTDLNEGLTALRQHQQRDLEITVEIDPASNELRVRHQASEVGSRIVAALREQLREGDEEVAKIEVSLQGVADFGERTRFFNELFKLTDFTLTDVRKVFTSGSVVHDEADENDEDALEVEDASATGIVRTLAMSGSNVTTSAEYQSLISTRFVHRAVWRMEEDKGDRSLIEFEAGFRKPGTGTDFEVSVRRIWERSDRTGNIKATPAPNQVLQQRRSRLLRLVEDRAASLASQIRGKLVQPRPPKPRQSSPTPMPQSADKRTEKKSGR